jgi:hypothetical protein
VLIVDGCLPTSPPWLAILGYLRADTGSDIDVCSAAGLRADLPRRYFARDVGAGPWGPSSSGDRASIARIARDSSTTLSNRGFLPITSTDFTQNVGGPPMPSSIHQGKEKEERRQEAGGRNRRRSSPPL